MNWERGGLVGTMIDQPTLLQDGQQIKLDDLLGSGFSVIGVNCRPEEKLSDFDREIISGLDASMISVSTSKDEPVDALDPLSGLEAYSGNDEAIIVVRPDRFIADIFSPDENKTKLSWMESSYEIRRAKQIASAA